MKCQQKERGRAVLGSHLVCGVQRGLNAGSLVPGVGSSASGNSLDGDKGWGRRQPALRQCSSLMAFSASCDTFSPATLHSPAETHLEQCLGTDVPCLRQLRES